jgi:hypothetical protein
MKKPICMLLAGTFMFLSWGCGSATSTEKEEETTVETELETSEPVFTENQRQQEETKEATTTETSEATEPVKSAESTDNTSVKNISIPDEIQQWKDKNGFKDSSQFYSPDGCVLAGTIEQFLEEIKMYGTESYKKSYSQMTSLLVPAGTDMKIGDIEGSTNYHFLPSPNYGIRGTNLFITILQLDIALSDEAISLMHKNGILWAMYQLDPVVPYTSEEYSWNDEYSSGKAYISEIALKERTVAARVSETYREEDTTSFFISFLYDDYMVHVYYPAEKQTLQDIKNS